MSAIPGVVLTGTAVPTDTADIYPVTDPQYGLGGYRTVSNHTTRNALTSTQRAQEGMLVYTQNDSLIWQLKAQGGGWTGTDSDWTQFAATTYTAGTGILISSNVVSISTSYTGQTSIVTLGTIATGTWHGTAVGILYGGTGATTATGAFDALAPLTTTGDIIYYNGTHGVRLGIGSSGQSLVVSGGVPAWSSATSIVYTGGTGITVSGSTISISTGYTGQTSITTVGTIATGIWNGNTIGVGFGGTGKTTAQSAFDNLSPCTTNGDTMYYNGSHVVRLAAGSAGQHLTIASGIPSWAGPYVAGAGMNLSGYTFSVSGALTNITSMTSSTNTAVQIDAHFGQLFTDTDGSTVTFNMGAANKHQVVLAGNRTLAVQNCQVGQGFALKLIQDATGGRTVTWFTTIKWPGGTVPTLTTTPNKADWFAFECTGTNAFDGFVIGQNL